MPVRSAFFALVLAAFAAPALAGADYLDRDNQFKVTIPDGWQKSANSDGVVDLVLQSPRFETTRGVCALVADPFVATQGMTQEKINEEMGVGVNEAFWKSALSRLGGVEIFVDEASSELRGGKRVFLATIRVRGTSEGKETWGRMRATLQILPGQIAMANCAAMLEHAPVEESDMSLVLSTFEALGPQLVARAPAPAPTSLLLYAGPSFNGNARELTAGVANLFQSGWAVPTGSFSVRGFGLWQLCDGANFAGNCRIVAGAESVAAGHRALRIGSARPLVDPRNALSSLGLAADALAAQAQTTFAKVTARRR
jgi:hypothetical protein